MSTRTSARYGSQPHGGSRPHLSVVYYPIWDLKLDPGNPRIHSQKQIRQIATSISTFGFNVPVLIDSQLQVIAGHGRVLAGSLLGVAEVPTIRLEHLTGLQLAAFKITDNRLTENSEWDSQLLAQQLKLLSETELDFSVEATGFEIGEIDILIEGLMPSHEKEPDPADAEVEANDKGATRPGDLWLLGPHRVLCGNSLLEGSYSTLMEKHKAVMVFTDPPYNVPIAGHAGGLGTIKHPDFKMGVGEMSRWQ